MSKLALVVEAERRGILSGVERELLIEARRRGLIAEPRNEVADALNHMVGVLSEQNAKLIGDVVKAVSAQRAPVVNVSPAKVDVQVPETTVNVEAVMPKQSPNVNGWVFTIQRDRNGWIESVRAERA